MYTSKNILFVALGVLWLFSSILIPLYATPKRTIPLESPLYFKGDMRFRLHYQTQDGSPDTFLGRYRLRLSTQKEVNPYTTIHLGLASGDNNPRSTFQTAHHSFQSPDLRLDFAFAEFEPDLTLTFRMGKFQTLFFTPSDLFFDFDLRRDGFEIQKHIGDFRYDYYFLAGFYLLDDFKESRSDPFLVGVQSKLDFLISPRFRTEASISYFETLYEPGSLSLDHSSHTNTRDENDHLIYSYSPIIVNLKLTQKNVLFFKFVSWTAEYGINTALADPEEAFLLGLTVGNAQLKNPGDWKGSVNFRILEKDSWLDIFPDSDAYFGQTDIFGTEYAFGYAIMPRVTLHFSLYCMDRLESDSSPFTLGLFDVSIVF